MKRDSLELESQSRHHVDRWESKKSKRMCVYMSVCVYDDEQSSLGSMLKQSNRIKQDQRTYIASSTVTSVGTYLQLNQVLPILFSTKMVIAGHTGRILKFWLQILNHLEIWVQKIYRSAHIMLLWVNLILRLEYKNCYNVSYKLDIKIPISNPESSHQIGPDSIRIKSFGGGHVMCSLYLRLIWP